MSNVQDQVKSFHLRGATQRFIAVKTNKCIAVVLVPTCKFIVFLSWTQPFKMWMHWLLIHYALQNFLNDDRICWMGSGDILTWRAEWHIVSLAWRSSATCPLTKARIFDTINLGFLTTFLTNFILSAFIFLWLRTPTLPYFACIGHAAQLCTGGQ